MKLSLTVALAGLSICSACAATHRHSGSTAHRVKPAIEMPRADFADLVAAARNGKKGEAGAILDSLTPQWESFDPAEREFLLGLSALELGRYRQAIDHFQAMSSDSPLEDYRRFFLGEAARGAGHHREAEAAFAALLREFPRSRWVALAKAQVQGKGNAKASAQDNPPREQPIAADDRSPATAEVAGQTAFRARAYPEAAEQLCGLVDRDEGVADRMALLRLCATALARAERPEAAIKRNRQIIDEAPGTRAASIALYKIGYLLTELGRYPEAIKTYEEWLAGSPRSGGSERDGFWAIAWARYRQGAVAPALKAFENVLAVAGGDPVWSGRAAYWAGRALETHGKRREARVRYQDAIAGTGRSSYYGRLAATRLAGTPLDPLYRFTGACVAPCSGGAAPVPPTSCDARTGEAGSSRAPVPSTPHVRLMENRDCRLFDGAEAWFTAPKARLLARLGLWTDALAEEARANTQPDWYRLGIDGLARRWLPDAAVVPAVIEQESHFRRNARSPAGAIGLMQIMPGTADRLVRELHWRDFQRRWLVRPLPNVQLGVWYLRTLLKRYDQALPLALASYNAGEAAVDRWLAAFARRRGEKGGTALPLDEFIEEIPYSETNAYVKKVLANYWAAR